MYKYVISELSNGTAVYVNLITSPAGHYLSRRPYVIKLTKEALINLDLTESKITIEHNMGRVIGHTDIVETSDKDTIYYAQPYKKDVFSRYAKNRFPLPSDKLTLILEKDSEGNYELSDTWIGPLSPPFPGDEHETVKSRSYWETHALVQDAQVVQSKTITKICPY